MRKYIVFLALAVLLLTPHVSAQQTPSPAEQAAALLPAYRADLDQAANWNRYTITANLEPQRQQISGRLTLSYTNRDDVALDRIYFRLFPNLPDFAGRLEISSLRVAGQNHKIVYEQGRYLLRVDLARRLDPQKTIELALEFRTSTPANAGRTYYGAFNLQGSVFALASCYPIVAMVQHGRWDIGLPDTRGDLVNSETALYDVILTGPSDWTFATTGSAIESKRANGRQTTRIVSGPQRDFMITAVKLQSITGDAGGTRVAVYYLPGDQAGAQAALRAAVNAIQVYSDRFGRYPLAEFELVPVDAGTFLGVEYPGMTLIERRLYKGDPDELEVIVAHEVAHQWWYSLVGNNVQREAWLDEAFATYAQVIYAEAIDGQAAADVELDQFRNTYRKLRSTGGDTIVSQPNTRIRRYYPVVYAKGALFFHALRNQIGEDAFRTFLKQYYADHRYKVANGADLIGTAELSCNCQLDKLYQDWILTAAPVVLP